ncbi:hypothetical protein H072_5950 [Dactylellina haptotyla CBS 200.50]|uniref:Dephospho-CoA kinase n=1 Tax=Dactylellina haptotyla (strain CBS 200.50) TaxID=1284197 RepID=S8BLI4_DACHA|nr:hypothetical protein H072_5950 [Dactylellina haptotyla CBS 200.50]
MSRWSELVRVHVVIDSCRQQPSFGLQDRQLRHKSAAAIRSDSRPLFSRQISNLAITALVPPRSAPKRLRNINKMLLIGLTGSIATGKSTVSRIFSSAPHSLPVVDADHLAHAVILPGTPAYTKILKAFLSTTPGLLHDPETDPNPSPIGPSINRKILGQLVFGTSEANKRDIKILNGIVHPAVRMAIFRSIVYYWLRGHWAIVLDIPLLFESRLDMFCGVTLLVGVSPELQLERLLKRDAHLTKEDGQKRIASQMALEKKKQLADVVVWNDGTKEELEQEIARFLERYRKGRGSFWTILLAGFWPLTATIMGWRIVGNWLKRKKKDERLNKKE